MVSEGNGNESASRSSTQFATTHWSTVLAAGDSASPKALAALERLCRCYWYPLYAFARRQGHSAADAQDSTQAFFERLISHEFIRQVVRERGRFRTFLLTAFKRFLTTEWQLSRAPKRGGGVLILPLNEDATEGAYASEELAAGTPDELYDHLWARTVMEHALRRLESECADGHRAREFAELAPFLSSSADPGEYADVGQRLDLNPHAVAAAVHRLRHRYREMVRVEIAHTVPVITDVDLEMEYLVQLLVR